MPTPQTSASRMERIRDQLQRTLEAERIDLIDESDLHVGHAGAREGKGHFRVTVVSKQFERLRPLQRHQLVYRALAELMNTDIHALSVTALTPDEAARGS